MAQMIDQMVAFFKEDEWPYTELEGGAVLGIVFQGQHGQWSCYAQAREEQQQFLFYSVCPVSAPANKREAMMEFITRANYGLVLGNFEMDLNDGEIRYKTSIDVEGADLTMGLLKPVVYANVMMMDQYLPGIMAIIYSDAPPDQAIAQVEG